MGRAALWQHGGPAIASGSNEQPRQHVSPLPPDGVLTKTVTFTRVHLRCQFEALHNCTFAPHTGTSQAPCTCLHFVLCLTAPAVHVLVLHTSILKKEAICSCETLVTTYRITKPHATQENILKSTTAFCRTRDPLAMLLQRHTLDPVHS